MAVELDPSFLGHSEQIKHCDQDQDDGGELPQQQSVGCEHW